MSSIYDPPVPGAASGVYSADQAQRIQTLDPEPDDLSRLPLDPQSPNNSTTTALANSLVCVSGPSRLFGFSGYSNRGSAQFIQVFDAQGLPSDGAVPVMVIPVGVGAGATTGMFSVYFGASGRSFDRGIVLCNSSTLATKTIGAADTWFDVQWI